ncbi:MAG: PAS domain S-box protein, partial [Methanobacterium sp.]
MDKPNQNDLKCQTRQSNTDFKEIFYQSPIGLLLYDKNGKLTNANDSALKIARIPKLDDVVGTNIFDNPTISSKKDELLNKRLINFQDSLDLNKIKENNIFDPLETKMIDIEWTISVIDSGYLVQIQDITRSKKAEEALKKSEENYKHLLNYAPTAIYEIDFKGPSFKSVNEAFIILSGYTRKELLSMNPIDILDPDSKKRFQERIKRGLAGQKIDDEVEYEVIHKDGSKLWVILNIKPIYKEDKIVGALVVGHDITKRRQDELLKQELLEKEQQLTNELQKLYNELNDRNADLQAVLDIAPIVLWIANDPECKVMTGNNYADQIVMNVSKGDNVSASAEMDAAAVTYKTFRDGVELLPEELPAQIAASTGKLVAETRVDLVFPDGRNVNLLVSAVPLFDDEGHVRGSITAGIDITHIKQTEDALRESEEKYRNMVETTNEGILMADNSGIITFANRKISEMLGYSIDELLGTDGLFLVDNESLEMQEKIKNRKEGIIESYETKFIRKDGSELWTLINGSPIYDHNGFHIGNLGMYTDITKRKKAEDEIEKTINELKRSNKELERFAYVSSHDLQEPLRMVTLYSQLLERRYKDKLDSDADDFIEYIVENAKRMRYLIDDLLEYSRVTSQAREFEDIDLEKVLENVLSNLSIPI